MRLLPALLALLAGCADPVPGDDDDDAASATLVGAPGVDIDEIAIFQGVKRPLVVGRAEVDSSVPLVPGRDALVRVYYDTDADYDGGDVTARLWIGQDLIEVVGPLGSGSSEASLESTINFEVPGDLVDDASWIVQILQDGDTDNPEAVWPAEGRSQLVMDGDVSVLRMVIAPFSYEFDGSGRLPDTSPEQVERIREEFLKIYPVSDVEVTVRDPEPWSNELSPNGDGWIGPGIALLGYRSADGNPDDVYYYGMFNPRETLQQWCFNGCLLGVTLLNDSPPDVGSVQLRLALGVGFAERAADVAAHEMGHAHGRQHAPCGPPGNLPDGIDPNYPYPNGHTGVWGWDIVTGELTDPADNTDIMGYCDRQFVSDYTFEALHRRGQNVNEGWAAPGPELRWEVLSIDGEGGAEFAGSTVRRRGIAGDAVDVTLFAAGGAPTSSPGVYLGWDHLPGGLLFVPSGQLAPVEAEFVLDGRLLRARR